MSTTALAPVPNKSLFECAEEVSMLIDCEETVTPSQREQYARDLALAMTQQELKINRVHGFLKHCKMNAAAAAEEVKRLQGAKKRYETAEENMREHIGYVLENVVQPDKAGKRALKTALCSFGLRGNAPHVEIQNEEMIPSKFKTATITLPVDTLNQLFGVLDESDLEGIQPIRAALKMAENEAAIHVNPKAVQTAIKQELETLADWQCPMPKDSGDTICVDGVLWSLTYSDSAPPDQRQVTGDCQHCAKHASEIEEARRSVPGAYLPAHGTNSVVVR